MPKFTFVTATARNHQSPHGRPASTLSPVKYYGGRIGNPPRPPSWPWLCWRLFRYPAGSFLAWRVGGGRRLRRRPPPLVSPLMHRPARRHLTPPLRSPPRSWPHPRLPSARHAPPALPPCFPPTPRAPARRARPPFGRPRWRSWPRSLLWWLLWSSLADYPLARDARRAADEWALAGLAVFALTSLWVRSAFALPWHGGFGFRHPTGGGSDGRRRHWSWDAPAIAGVLNFR